MTDRTLLDAATTQWIDNQASQGILTTDRELTIRTWNHWLESHSGLDAASVIGRNLLEVFPELVSRRLEQHFRDALLGRVRVLAQSLHGYLIALRSETHDPAFSTMQQSARIAPLEKDGEIIGTITLIEDVTERVAREAELRNQITALEDW